MEIEPDRGLTRRWGCRASRSAGIGMVVPHAVARPGSIFGPWRVAVVEDGRGFGCRGSYFEVVIEGLTPDGVWMDVEIKEPTVARLVCAGIRSL